VTNCYDGWAVDMGKRPRATADCPDNAPAASQAYASGVQYAAHGGVKQLNR
jgi:hypothetical protein